MLATGEAAETPDVLDKGEVRHQPESHRLEDRDEQVGMRPAVERHGKLSSLSRRNSSR